MSKRRYSRSKNTPFNCGGFDILKSYLKMAKFVSYPQRGLVQMTEKGAKALERGKLPLEELQSDPDFIKYRESVKK